MWTARLSADEGDRHRTGRPRPRTLIVGVGGPHPVVRRLRVLLLGTSGAQRVPGPWPAQAMWQVCGITAMPSGGSVPRPQLAQPAPASTPSPCPNAAPTAEGSARGVER